MTKIPVNSHSSPDHSQVMEKNSPKINSQDQSYSISMKSDLQPLFYLGLIIFGIFSIIFLVDDSSDVLVELPWLPTLLIFCLVGSFIGLLFWKITKVLIFSAETGKIRLRIQRFNITLYSRNFLIEDCIKFDIQFFPQRNASYLVLQNIEKKPIKLQIKKKTDEVNIHLIALNNILFSIKGEKYPSSVQKIEKIAIDEENCEFDRKRKISRDFNNQIVMSTKYHKFVAVTLLFIPFAVAYATYLIYSSEPLNDAFSLSFFSTNLLFALNFMVIIYVLFIGIRVTDPHTGSQNEILSGSPLFNTPNFLQNIVSVVKTTYIEPEQVKTYKKIRLGLIITGFIPTFAFFVFYLFYLL
ncbi:hypothetical protein NEF87_004867 [Candidatus Lokiarchaeum ossiferum]|uniref:PH domain-containing protein n=1 Tax=Candidatus Lokiarchaeum ossiferum TaxID=2951803 RepID=A0ABY6I0D4_9ARCH|nr:hypothetical protein NEF87_004867 [Candidatus Lokiarchaeum sp. B-35]